MTEVVEEVSPLKKLEPQINYQLSQYGLSDDPLARSKAKVLASRAIKAYDPNSGASLNTWVDRSLQPLSRFKRERSFAVQLPERAVLDNYSVRLAEIEFEESNGRLPEMDELADAAGVSMKRLSALRKAVRPQVSENALDGASVEKNMEDDTMDEALSSIWNEADKMDRKIIEMKTGFGGRNAPMTAGDVAVALGMTPVQLSRRSTRITAKLDQILELMGS